jgi:hypothetical protein
MMKDSRDMDDLSLDDDLDGIFDDDDNVDTGSTDALEMEMQSANSPFDFFEPLETPSAVESSVLSLSQVDSVCASLTPISFEPRRRRQSLNRGADGNAPAAGWHSEDADKTHRQRMIHEM